MNGGTESAIAENTGITLSCISVYVQCAFYKIYNEGGISKSSYYEWKRGKSLPTVENLIKLANVLNCSVDFVLGRENRLILKAFSPHGASVRALFLINTPFKKF